MSLIKQIIPTSRKFTPASDINWTRVETLVHGPGAGAGHHDDINSAVFACLFTMASAYPEPPLTVVRKDASGKQEKLTDSPLQQLLDRPTPNGELSMDEIRFWLSWAKHVDGNAYWLKVRSGNAETGNPVQLWPISPTLIGPVTEKGSDDWISYYKYQVAPGVFERVPVTNIVHFRLGLDDRDMRKGLAPLKALVRQISTDEEADRFVDILLKNYAIPGLVVIPDESTILSQDDAEEMTERLRRKFGSDNRGNVAVMSKKSTVSAFGFSPKDMDMSILHRIPEERISAVIGVPAIVAGLGAGLDRACVPAYARVQTPYGTKTVDEIQAGMVVWSFRDGQIVPRLVSHKWVAKRDVIYEIKTANRCVRATGNHPFMARTPGNSQGGNETRHPGYEWRQLSELKKGDYIIAAKNYPDQNNRTLPDGQEATVEMMKFLGVIIGDGTVTPGVGVRIAMPPADRCRTQYEELASNLFSRQVRQSGGDIALQEALPRTQIVIQNQKRSFGFSSAMDSRKLDEWGVAGRAHTKRIPDWIFGLARDLRLAFLAGVVDSDGYINDKGMMILGLCNRALLEDIRDLFVSVGIRPCNIGHSRLTADVLPNHGTKGEYETWRFTISSARQVAEIPFTDPLYRARVDANPNRHDRYGFDAHKTGLSDDLGFVRILSITPIGEDDVFDLTVEDGHSFFCENVLISNTYANFKEAREMFTEQKLVPQWRADGGKITSSLRADFTTDKSVTVTHDLTDVRAFQEDEDAKYRRLQLAVGKPWVTRNEARTDTGLDVVEGWDEADLDAAPPAPPAPANNNNPPANGNNEQQPPETGDNQNNGKAADLKRWERKALNLLKKGLPAGCDFDSDALPEEIAAEICAGLANCKTEADVKALFAQSQAEPDPYLLAVERLTAAIEKLPA